MSEEDTSAAPSPEPAAGSADDAWETAAAEVMAEEAASSDAASPPPGADKAGRAGPSEPQTGLRDDQDAVQETASEDEVEATAEEPASEGEDRPADDGILRDEKGEPVKNPAAYLSAQRLALQRREGKLQARQKELDRVLKEEVGPAKEENRLIRDLVGRARQDPDAFIVEMLRVAGLTPDDWARSLQGRSGPDPMREVSDLKAELARRDQAARQEREAQAARDVVQRNEGLVRTTLSGDKDGERWPLVADEDVGDVTGLVVRNFVARREAGEELALEALLDDYERHLRRKADAKFEKNPYFKKKVGLKAAPGAARPRTQTAEMSSSPSGARRQQLSLDDEWERAAKEVFQASSDDTNNRAH